MSVQLLSRTFAVVLILTSVALSQEYLITTIAGGALPPTPVLAVNAQVLPKGLAIGAGGNLYFISHNCVFKLDAAGMVARVAGASTVTGFSGDDGPATSAQLNVPVALAADGTGTLYIADSGNGRIRKVAPNGTITTVAGNGATTDSGDGGPATGAGLTGPRGLAVDREGNLYISTYGHTVRKVSKNGIIATVAGTGSAGFSGDNGPATQARLYLPQHLAFDGSGNLYIDDSANYRIRKVTTNGIISTVAGTGTAGYSGDGGRATNAQFSSLKGISADAIGNLYIADYENYVIRKVSASGTIATVAGDPDASALGDGGPATEAGLGCACGVATSPTGDLYIAGDGRIRKIASGGIITTIAGSGSNYGGDGGPADFALLDDPRHLAVDTSGNLYIADAGNDRIRAVGADGTITTFAGNGVGGFSGDDGPAPDAQLNDPRGLAVDSAGNSFIADYFNNRVRMVGADHRIFTIAGDGTFGSGGDGGPATNAQFYWPTAVAIGPSNNLYVLDSGNNIIRRIASGTITTVAGGGWETSTEGGLATEAQLLGPNDLAFGANGAYYISTKSGQRIRQVTSDGKITTVAGSSFGLSQTDGIPALNASISSAGIAADAVTGSFYFSQRYDRIRKVDSTGIVTTIAGTAYGYSGDGGPAMGAGLNNPSGITVAPGGILYFADSMNNAVRMLVPSGTRPVLRVAKTHSAEVTSGQSSMTYSVVVSNAGNAGPTTGTVTVTDLLPAGLTLSSMTGAGWNCSSNVCTRDDVLNGGASYPEITVVVAIASDAPSQIVNRVTVSGGGSSAAAASDTITIPPACAYGIDAMMTNASGAGASGSLGVNAETGCSWTASSNAPWLTITSGNSGDGNGTVSYSVQPNPTSAPRTAVITVGGLMFAVGQTGAPVSGDFDHSGTPDLFWQNDSTRQGAVWYLGGANGTTMTGYAYPAPGSYPGWKLITVADFDRNGQLDLVWQHDTTRKVGVWLMGGANGMTPIGYVYPAPGSYPGWTLVSVADMDRNGVPDLVWQEDSTRKVGVWYLDGPQGLTVLRYSYPAAGSYPGWTVVGAGDFNKDGVPDLVWQEDSTRKVGVWYMSGPLAANCVRTGWLAPGNYAGWKVVSTVDFDGNGTPDLVWQHDTTRRVGVWYLSGSYGTQVLGYSYPAPGNYPGWRAFGPR